jgi:hypothetical protein
MVLKKEETRRFFVLSKRFSKKLILMNFKNNARFMDE